jgi:hypothetical protein
MWIKQYSLRTKEGNWLGQIILTEDGMFSAVTDYGNFAFAWRYTSQKDFRQFLTEINFDYFAGKMQVSLSYCVPITKKIESACLRFAEKILPALQLALTAELDKEKAAAAENDNYDKGIHVNPDAREWAKFYCSCHPGADKDMDDLVGWFSNAMMAMHDHLLIKKADPNE